MSTAQDQRNGTTNVTRLAAATLFLLMVGLGYSISPRVEGAIASPAAAEEQEIMEPEFLPSDCAVDGLVFAECDLDF